MASASSSRGRSPRAPSGSPFARNGSHSLNGGGQLQAHESFREESSSSIAASLIHIPYIPFFYRVKPYRGKDLGKDILAGVIAAVVAIPQGLAYAMLAGLPPVVGLYTAALAPMIYAVLGTSNVCSIGPNALVTMFLPQIIARLKFGPDPVMASGRASLAAVAVGVVMMCIGLARLGGLVRFISSPVLAGFTNAAALVMAMSQLPNLLGFYMPGLPYNYQQLSFLASHIYQDTNHLSLSIGLGTILLLYTFRAPRRFFPKSKAAKALFTASTLIVVVLATLIARWIARSGHHFAILGTVPGGLPRFGLPHNVFNDVSDVGDIIAACFPVALVAFMSQWSVARKYAERTNQVEVLDPNQEAFALGAANIISGCFHCFPTAASFSRTALNADSGARSPLSNLFVGIVVLVALIAFTPYLYYLPLACLGGIIEVALLNLIETEPFYKAYRVARPDFVVMVASFVFTAVVNIQSGLVMGIILSIAVLLQELSEIQTSVLVPVHTHGALHMRSRSVAGWDVDEHELVKVIRLVTSVFFGNTDALKETFKDILCKGGDQVFAVVIDAAGTFRDRLGAAELWEVLGSAKFEHMSTDEVVNHLLAEADLKKGGGGGDDDPEAPTTWPNNNNLSPSHTTTVTCGGCSKRMSVPSSPIIRPVAESGGGGGGGGSSSEDRGEEAALLGGVMNGGANTTPGGTFQ